MNNIMENDENEARNESHCLCLPQCDGTQRFGDNTNILHRNTAGVNIEYSHYRQHVNFTELSVSLGLNASLYNMSLLLINRKHFGNCFFFCDDMYLIWCTAVHVSKLNSS